jgi:glycosyltransferase involved in cell wall biosynthesis
MHRKIKDAGLPIDILVCSDRIEPDDHLIVMPPLCEFAAPFYNDQPVRIPNLLDLHRLFLEREYDRVLCSTEGVMGLMALYLQKAYSVEAAFYVHTDWVMFARKVLNLDTHNLNRIRRMLRAFYGSFDKVFVLNADQREWLTGAEMQLRPEAVRLTAHWADEAFSPQNVTKQDLLGIANETPVLLYAGRLSAEKGVMELPDIYRHVRKTIPDVRLVIAGSGPAADALRTDLPEAIRFDWLDRSRLAELYSCADLLLFPSRFDTFGCAVLEALSCGLPVVAYKTKGPKDIILHERNGYIVHTARDMTDAIIAYLSDRRLHPAFRKAAVARAADYNADAIMADFIAALGLA